MTAETKGPLLPGQTRVTVKGMGEWVLDENTLDLRDAFAIKATASMTIPQVLGGVVQMDPLAMQVLVWFLRMKAGDTVPLESINFRLADLDLEQGEVEQEDDGEKDPTTGAGSTD